MAPIQSVLSQYLRGAKLLLLTVVTTALIACGGAPSDATVPPSAPDSSAQPPVTAQATVVSQPATSSLPGAPPTGLTVVRYELVSSTRVSRTVFDYTYRVMVQVGGQNYPNGALLTVSSTSPATTFPDPNVSLGPLVSFSIAEPTDTLTLRQDRTVTFDGDSLHWSASGETVAEPAPPLKLLSIDFVTERGRVGHTSLLPIRSRPRVGPHLLTLQLTRPVLAADVVLKTPAGDILDHASMAPRGSTEPSTKDWYGTVSVPNTEFFVQVIASTPEEGTTTLAFARSFLPTTTDVSLLPGHVRLRSNEAKTVRLRVTNDLLASNSLLVTVPATTGFEVTPASQSIFLDADGSAEAVIEIRTSAAALHARTSIPISVTSSSNLSANTEVFLDVSIYQSQ